MRHDKKIIPIFSEMRSEKAYSWEIARDENYHEYRRLWKEYPEKQAISNGPLHLDLETTSNCNLLCPYCPRTAPALKGEFPVGSMSFKFYSDIIDQRAEFGARSVKLNFLGEPLLHPDLSKQIRHAKKRGFVDVMLNTNATLLTESMSHKILDAGLDSIFFSFDSTDRETFRKMRVGADFDEVKRNIFNFIEIKDSGGYNHVHTRLNVTLLKQSKEDLTQLQDMFLDKVGIIGFGRAINPNEKFGGYGIVENFVCAQPFQRIFINYDGTVFPCCLDRFALMKMGNAHDTPIVDIWHNEKYQLLREHMKNGTYHELELCQDCYAPHCKQDTVISASSEL